jgi:predicted peptidase
MAACRRACFADREVAALVSVHVRKRFAITVAVFVATTPALSGGQTAQVFESEFHSKVRVPYLLFQPWDYNKHLQRHWPLILCLHGGSLRGDNVERLPTLGLPYHR